MHKTYRNPQKRIGLSPAPRPEELPALGLEEHDACAIVASVRKTGQATHGNLKRALDALSKMGHRSGSVKGEGDGCGVLTDIPRKLWASALAEAGKPAWLAEDRRFFVGHLMIPSEYRENLSAVKQQIAPLMDQLGASLLVEREALTRPTTLGRMAHAQMPYVWQIAGVLEDYPLEEVEGALFELGLAIERCTNVHIASLSSHSVVYKVRGSIETLYQYYPELRSPDFMTAITLGHARYSTNTTTIFERVQPFTILGHNGEINTIARLREQAQMLGIQLVPGGSDSQDVDRTIGALVNRYHYSLAEAMELIFPPILSEVACLPEKEQQVYNYFRQAFGPYAQGPAGMIARFGDECVFSVDALGLRPLWFGETEKEYFFSSEKGVYHLDLLCSDPRPLAPGEKMSVRLCRDEGVEVLEYHTLRRRMMDVHDRIAKVGSLLPYPDENWTDPETLAGGLDPGTAESDDEPDQDSQVPAQLLQERRMAAFGWAREDRDWVQALADSGKEPISSMGYDGPLAALSEERQNLADYFKEAVAVVTNPSIDREREVEHFSTQTLIGPRPALGRDNLDFQPPVALDCPILLGGHSLPEFLSIEMGRKIARQAGGLRLEDLLAIFGPERVSILETITLPDESVQQACTRLAEAACRSVRNGAQLILLDDRTAFRKGQGWIDPLLAIACVDRALQLSFNDREETGADDLLKTGPIGLDFSNLFHPPAQSLRRQTGLVLCSGAIRGLHDLMLAIGFGADAVAPYLLFEVAAGDPVLEKEPAERSASLDRTLQILQAGIEKVISTMGIHELRGYGRLFASLGLSQPLADALSSINYAGSQARGLSWQNLDVENAARAEIATGLTRPQLSRQNHFYPKIWKAAGQVARGEVPQQSFEQHAEELALKLPVTLRHVLDFNFPSEEAITTPAPQVDAGLTGHNLPFVIASMSFGSQGETAFRSYAQAAGWLNIIALNGEGGEIKDMLGLYPHNRGQQIASGRFGVNIELINSSNLLEIKIGQGAKPGEGGHLPGRKVTKKIAETRHASPGVDLISPSNNHDIYSIEDLAQFIEELKTANPKARVAVKMPVVPGIGIIAVGVAKAGADIINLSGYDGGTGAARQHSIKNVGLPAEIGVVGSHRALTESGLRSQVELWCDGGVRTAADVVKMICLGANRVGFGSLAMVAAGCTICRDCQTGTCHVGITTQIASQEQAEALGLRRFVPCNSENAVRGLINLFSALGEGVKTITSRLGFSRTQDLVGRSDLLVQRSHFEQLDLSELLQPVESGSLAVATAAQGSSNGRVVNPTPLRRPRNHLTTAISNLVMETFAAGESQVSFEDDKVTPVDRALGTHLTGALTRYQQHWNWLPGHGGVGGAQETWREPLNGHNGNGQHVRDATLRFYASSIPGNGLGAYNAAPVSIIVEGGAQDGVAKGMQGGRVVILKGYNHDGQLIDGSVGKSLGYGATGGQIIIQGDADSRACIRLSGTDVIIGGEIQRPLDDSRGCLGARANVKGFLCEYMTDGRVLVMGDPGPWMCAGMTGGVLYLRLQPEMNFDLPAIERRIAKGAGVIVRPVDSEDEANLQELLSQYADELQHNHQQEEAQQVLNYLQNWRNQFVRVTAKSRQLDQSVATE